MEEDIEYRIKRFLDECEDGNWYWDDGVDAIENLIKGYRELEKDLHEMTISNNHKKENWIHKNCLNDYIPKSKIKEKIEELRNKLTWGYIDWKYDENVYMAEHHMLDEIEKELMEDK